MPTPEHPEPEQPWPRNLSNAQLAAELEDWPTTSSAPLLFEAQRRQAIDWLRSHVDQEPT